MTTNLRSAVINVHYVFVHTRYAYIVLHITGVIIHCLDMTQNSRRSIHYVIPDDVRFALQKRARKERRSMSFIMTEALRVALELPEPDKHEEAEVAK